MWEEVFVAFDAGDLFLCVITTTIVMFILTRSIFFLLQTCHHKGRVNVSGGGLGGAVLSATVFAVTPTVSVLLNIISLTGFLNVPLP